MKTLVRYHNKLNETQFHHLTANETNLFFAICAKLKGRGTETATFTFKEFRSLTQYTQESYYHFINNLEATLDKVLRVNHKTKNNAIIMNDNLFAHYAVYLDEHYFELKASERFAELLNNLDGNFTQFYLEEFVSLRSIYSKTLYRLLKQFQGSGYVRMSIETFREYLDIPKSYRMSQINSRILEPSTKELEPFFHNLKVKKVRGARNSVIALEFVYDNKITPKRKTTRHVAMPAYTKPEEVSVSSEEVEQLKSELKEMMNS